MPSFRFADRRERCRSCNGNPPFAQFSIQPQRALLALASGYIFSSSFAFLQTLAFPGAYAPAGLIGDANTAAWMFALWHTTFPTAILAYALSKDVTRVAIRACEIGRAQQSPSLISGRRQAGSISLKAA
jgi:hypothetical protein